ncbi:serine protease 33-like isoform X2 [Hypanus sabinus]|uniref:serine protease 33-like isoform X2 n=1 Tax=Hypanus sabinus TaxID=79690 RepID=UPI0028C38C10|nr:serine protease 33-like isoform X2 [Hypanus sabinus]
MVPAMKGLTRTQNVLTACKELGIRYLLHTSSMEVVGPNKKGDHFIRGNEDTNYRIYHKTAYTQSKAAAEKLVLNANGMKIAGEKTLVTCSLRPTGIYGEDNPIMAELYRMFVSHGSRRLRLAGKEVEHGRVYVGLRTGEAQYPCGRRVISNRIVGGTDAIDGSWPWQVSIHQDNKHICGATLISADWVLTAAHCVASNLVRRYLLYFGRYQQNGINTHENSSSVAYILIHSKYRTAEEGYDIALLRLPRSISFSDYIIPICLPSSTYKFSCGPGYYITGWGHVGESVSLSNPGTLQEVSVNLIGRETCDAMYNNGNTVLQEVQPITDHMLCAGVPQGNKDACQGDSGGPLMFSVNGVWIQVGIVSFGEGCGRPDRPGVYTEVAAFSQWIQANVNNLQFVFPENGSRIAPDGCMNGAEQVRGMLLFPAASLLVLLLCTFLLSE